MPIFEAGETGASIRTKINNAITKIDSYGDFPFLDEYTGDGTTKDFDLSYDPQHVNNLRVVLGGVEQTPLTDFNLISGSPRAVRLTTAPLDNIAIRIHGRQPTTTIAAEDAAGVTTGTGLSVQGELNRRAMTFATRAALVTYIATYGATAGQAYIAAGARYEASTGATAISDLPGLLPSGAITLGHWGASSSATAAANAAAVKAALEYGGYVGSGGCGVLNCNNIEPTLTRDTHFLLQAGDTIKGATGMTTEVMDIRGAYAFTIYGGGKIDTSATIYSVGVASGTGLVLDQTLKSATVWNIQIYAGATKQLVNGDSGVSGTCANVTIMGCTFTGIPDTAIYQAGTATSDANGFYDGPLGGNWTVIGNTFKYCSNALNSKRNSWGGTFSGNWVEWCNVGFVNLSAGSPLTLAPGKGWQVTGNQFHKIKSRAIEFRGLAFATCSDNLIVDFGRDDDGVTTLGSATYGIYIRGGQNISGTGNIVTFKEWATYSLTRAVRFEPWTFAAGDPNEVVYEPDQIDLEVTTIGCHTAVNFDTGIGTCDGRLQVTSFGHTTLTSGTVPTGLRYETIIADDHTVMQDGEIAWRILNRKLGNVATADMDAALAIRSVDALGSLDGDSVELARFVDKATGRNMRITLRRTAAEGATIWHNTAIRIENNVDDNATAQSWLEMVNGAGTTANSIRMGFGTSAASFTMDATGITSTLPVIVPSFTVAGLPTASGRTGGIVYVSNEVGGAVLAFSDGTNWRRVTDRAIAS